MAVPIRVGTAGWSYKDWAGPVYPKPAPKGFDPLEFLARYFEVVEINNTFYRPQPKQVARDWCRRVEGHPRFRFTAKLLRRFTHERGEAFTQDEVKQAREAFDVLADEGRLGALLIQFPWSFKRGEAEQEWLSDVIAAFAPLPLVVEVRHESWNVPAYFAELEARGVGFVNVDQPRFHRSIGPSARATSPVAYVRVHGRNYHDWFRKNAGRDARYDYLYTEEELIPWAERARSLAESGRTKEVYVVTNNHFRGQAAANAVMLRGLIEGSPQTAPETLRTAFPEALRPFVIEPGAPSLHAP